MRPSPICKAKSFPFSLTTSRVIPHWFAIVALGASVLLASTNAFASENTSSSSWQTFPTTSQTDRFVVTFDMVAEQDGIDALTGLANGDATTFSSLAAIVRFNPDGQIDARNGGSYAADVEVNYRKMESFAVRMDVDVPAKTYSVFITPEGQSEVALATDYAFRTEQAGVTSLDGWALLGWVGTHTVSNMKWPSAGEQTPFHGSPAMIPGRIQAEDYDLGKGNFAYFDSTSGNTGGAYRADGVDIEAAADADGGYNVGWIVTDEWLDYTVNVQQAGTYDLNLRVARSPQGSGAMRVLLDGRDVSSSIAVPSTGGWQEWVTVTIPGVELNAGQQVMRLAMESSLFNLNWIEFVANSSDTELPSTPTGLVASNVTDSSVELSWVGSTDNVGVTGYKVYIDGANPKAVTGTSTTLSALSDSTSYAFTVASLDAAGNESDPSSPVQVTTASPQTNQTPFHGSPASVPGRIQAEDYDLGKSGIAYFDTTASNSGGAHRDDDVDLEATSDTGGGFNVGWIASGEWLEYTVDVEKAGTYDINLRVARNTGGNGALRVLFNGADVTGSISVPNTGGWQSWTTVSAPGVSLNSGQQIMRLSMEADRFNVNWLEIVEATPGSAPTITQHPQSATRRVGEQVQFSGRSTGDPAPSYQWRQNGSELSGKTASSLTILNVQSANEGAYDVVVSNDYGIVTSNSASLTVVKADDDSEPDVKPTGKLTAEGFGPTMVRLRWATPSDSDSVVGYDVYRNGSYLARVTLPQFLDSGLQPQTKYSYEVYASDAADNRSSLGTTQATTSASLTVVGDCNTIQPGQLGRGRAINVIVPVIAVVPSSNSQPSHFNWTFSSGGGDAFCGRFANGDYWVAPATGAQVRIDRLTTNNGNVAADVNPIMEATGLMNGAAKTYGNHDASQNIVPRLPVTLSGIDSVVAAKQRNESATSKCSTRDTVGGCIDAYHIVTVLPGVPAGAGGNMIRPNITGEQKIILSMDDFDFSRVPSNSLLSGTNAEGLETIRTRWSHSTGIFGLKLETWIGEAGRAWRPVNVHGEYGAGMAARELNPDVLALFSSSTSLEAKKPALAALIAYGHDTYHARFNGPPERLRGWSSGAGQHLGSFLPPALMAALMVDESYADVLKLVGPNAHSENEWERGPQEMRQLNTGPDGALVWGDIGAEYGTAAGPSALEERYYWARMWSAQCFDTAQGSCRLAGQNSRDPYGYIDGGERRPGDGYIQVSLGSFRGLAAAQCVMPELAEVVNYPPLLEYLDRVDSLGTWTQPDPCAAPPRDENADCSPWDNNGQGANCKYFRKTWGPDPQNQGKCIKGGTGRFPSRHGAAIEPTGAYVTWEVERKWPELRKLCR